MKPSVGRIVLVRSPAFEGEAPAIVTHLYNGVSEQCIDCRVFTNDEESPLFLQGIAPQSESSKAWGWRWPPHELLERLDVGSDALTVSDAAPHEAVALSAQEPLQTV